MTLPTDDPTTLAPSLVALFAARAPLYHHDRGVQELRDAVASCSLTSPVACRLCGGSGRISDDVLCDQCLTRPALRAI